MRYGIFLFIVLLVGCGREAAPEEEGSGNSAVEEVVTEDQPSKVAEEEPLDIEALVGEIRATYQEIERGKNSGALKKDSVRIDCYEGEIVGKVYLYTQEGQTVLVDFGMAQGDHGGTGEAWYFQEGEPVFVFGESSYWQFAGPEREMPDGTTTMGTKDVFSEERFYVHEGKVIRALTKDYEVLSWADEPTNPDNVPNQLMETDGTLPTSWDFVAEVMKSGMVDCELLD